jgi:hypothetical protein
VSTTVGEVGERTIAACFNSPTRVWWLTNETNLPAMLLYDRIAEKSGFMQYRKAIGWGG